MAVSVTLLFALSALLFAVLTGGTLVGYLLLERGRLSASSIRRVLTSPAAAIGFGLVCCSVLGVALWGRLDVGLPFGPEPVAVAAATLLGSGVSLFLASVLVVRAVTDG